MPYQPLYVVDIMGDIVSAVDAVLFPTLAKHIFYYYGTDTQITAKVQKLAQSNTLKDSWYPIVALVMPFPEQTGTGYTAVVKFPKISISTLSNLTDDPMVRYEKNFKPTLYKIYGEFLNQVARNPFIISNDPGALQLIKSDIPYDKPMRALNYYMDSIEIAGLQLTFQVLKKCS